MCRKISAHVDGGLSGGSRVRRPGSEDPHRRERIFFDNVSVKKSRKQKICEGCFSVPPFNCRQLPAPRQERQNLKNTKLRLAAIFKILFIIYILFSPVDTSRDKYLIHLMLCYPALIHVSPGYFMLNGIHF